MILLTPIFHPDTTPADIEASKAQMGGYSVDQFIAALNAIYEGNLSESSFAVDTAQDEDGNIYTGIAIKPSFRFIKNGIRYFGAGDLAVDLDAMVGLLRQLA